MQASSETLLSEAHRPFAAALNLRSNGVRDRTLRGMPEAQCRRTRW
jgi:hypothetical protein